MDVSVIAKSISTSGIRKMFNKASQYDDTINMSIGEPCFITPKHIIQAGVDCLMNGETRYTPNAGIMPYREAVAEKLIKENNIKCDAENVLATFGACEAIMLALVTLVNPGEEVIIPDPAWPNYISQVKMVNAVPVGAKVSESNGFKMTADVIEPYITEKTKMIIINSPNNPTGSVLNRGDLEKIAELVKKHKIYIISDEPYEHIIYDGEKHISLASFEGLEDYVITVNTFSKTYAMCGFRLGYACANKDIMKQMIKLQENNGSCVNSAFQNAGVYALKHGQQDIAHMLETYTRNRKLMVEGLNKIKGFSCQLPKGAFYAYPNISGLKMSSSDAADLILEKTHVITTPGTAFGDSGTDNIRLCFANDYNSIENALERMINYFGAK